MLRIFTFILLIFCGGCLSPGPTEGQLGADPVFTESAARNQCRTELQEIRTDENFQRLRHELQYQALELSLPGRIAHLSAIPTREEIREARQTLQTAQLFLQELTSPDSRSARERLKTRSAELLDMEFTELSAVLLAREKEIAALELALQAEKNAPALQQKMREAQTALAHAQMGLRTMLGLPAGSHFVLQPDWNPPEPLPQGRQLETALACRKELRNSRFKPEELAAAVRACTDQKYTSPRHRALAAALLLLQAPRDLYRRQLASLSEPEGMRELLTAIGIAAELELAQAELLAARQEAETAALMNGKDHRSLAEAARLQARVGVAQAHLAAALGGVTRHYPATTSLAEPPEQLLKLSALLEKWEHE